MSSRFLLWRWAYESRLPPSFHLSPSHLQPMKAELKPRHNRLHQSCPDICCLGNICQAGIQGRQLSSSLAIPDGRTEPQHGVSSILEERVEGQEGLWVTALEDLRGGSNEEGREESRGGASIEAW